MSYPRLELRQARKTRARRASIVGAAIIILMVLIVMAFYVPKTYASPVLSIAFKQPHQVSE